MGHVECLSFSCSFILFLSLFHFSSVPSFRDCLSCKRVQLPCDSLFLLWLLLQITHPLIGPSIFKWLGYFVPLWLLVRFCVLGSYCLAGASAVALMLHWMAFPLAGKIVALQFDNNPVKAYLCNQGGTVSPFLSRLGCHILHLANKHGITCIPAYFPTHINVEADFLSLRKLVPEWCLPFIAQWAFQVWSQPETDLLASSCTNQC